MDESKRIEEKEGPLCLVMVPKKRREQMMTVDVEQEKASYGHSCEYVRYAFPSASCCRSSNSSNSQC